MRRVGRLALALVLLGGFFIYGFLCAWYRIFPFALLKRGYEAAAQVRVATSAGHGPDTSALLAIPYLQGYNPATGRRNVTVHERGQAYEGLNLFTSGHAPEAFLMDMDGRILHEWRYEFARAWPGRVVEPENRSADRFWRRAHLLGNGDLLAIFEGLGLVKLDAASRLLWTYGGNAHHDLAVARDGSIRVLTRQRTIRAGQPALEDHITLLDPEGRPLESTSLLRCLENSDYAALLDGMPGKGDLLHTNRLQVLGDEVSAAAPFQAGRALVSFYTIGAIALVDLPLERVVWALSGLWRRPHDPTLLPTGRILAFDNGWDERARRSRVIEFDPRSQEVVWDYGRSEGESFYTPHLGESQRLPNGNTLVVESAGGRALEVTAERRIVWEFVSPFRVGERGEFVASLTSLRRLPADFPFPGSASRGPAAGR